MPRPNAKKPQNNRMQSQAKHRSKAKPEPVSITKSKFYWIGLIIVTVAAIVLIGIISGIIVQKLTMIMVTILLVLAFAWQVRVKQSTLSLKTRATYIFVGAAILGFGVWALFILTLAATGIGVSFANALGDQFLIITSQIIFIVIGGFIGEYLSANNTFQGVADKFRQKFG